MKERLKRGVTKESLPYIYVNMMQLYRLVKTSIQIRYLDRKPTLLFLITLCSLCCLLIVSCYDTNSETQTRTVIKSVTLSELKKLPEAEPPIESGKEAISYSINIEWVYLGMIKMAHDFGQEELEWNVVSQSITEDSINRWQIQIESPKKIPKPRCVILLDVEGRLVGSYTDNFCGYDTSAK